MEDQLIGVSMLAVSTAVFLYYSIWVLVLPFVDANQALQQYFLPREYAIIIPCVLLIVGLAGVFTFLSCVMIKAGRKQKSS